MGHIGGSICEWFKPSKGCGEKNKLKLVLIVGRHLNLIEKEMGKFIGSERRESEFIMIGKEKDGCCNRV